MGKLIANTNQDVVDINLSEIQSKRFRIDGDDDRILTLNTTDLGILSRLKEAYPKLISFTQDAVSKLPEELPEIDENESILEAPAVESIISVLKEIDANMRKQIDYIFNSNVSDVCAPDGSMFDPINGKFRYEHIIDKLSNLYSDDISNGMNKISTRVRKHTDKYIRK